MNHTTSAVNDTAPAITDARRVIVNADDFGMSDGVNAGIITAHRLGIVTSTSLMVDRPGAADAVAMARSVAPHLSIGLHLELIEHQVVNGNWVTSREEIDINDARQIEAATREQLDRFVDLVGMHPTHLDSHQHAHLAGAAGPVVANIAAEWDLQLRSVTLPYRGSFYGQYGVGIAYRDGITPAALVAAVGAGGDSLVEVGCHPAQVIDFADTYGAERLIELRSLCDDEVSLAIEMAGVELVSRTGRIHSRASAYPVGS